MRRVVVLGAGAALVWACTEELTAPAVCPDYCPDYGLGVVDTVLRTNLDRDSAFRGYVRPQEAVALPVVDIPAVQSRAIVRTEAIPATYTFGIDPTPYPIDGVDSVQVEFRVVRPDSTPRNLTVGVYRLAKDVDSLTTFADAAGSFVPDSLAHRVNFDTLRAKTVVHDPVIDDSVRIDSLRGDLLYVDRERNRLLVRMRLDSADAPYVPADSGRLGLGFAVTADSLAQLFLGSGEGAAAVTVSWYLRVDSAGSIKSRIQPAGATFDGFVLDPPAAALDSTLVVGGAPSARSLLRLDLPRAMRDSSQIIRATLVLVPDGAVRGVPRDSFLLAAYRAGADLGAKSPLALPRGVGDSAHVGLVWLQPGSSDTVRVEVTPVLRFWASDTTRATTFVLTQLGLVDRLAEGVSVGEVRFFPSRAAAFRPALHITYVPRVRIGLP
jgi:hypothetical protein